MSSISVTAIVILVLVSIAALAQQPGDIFRNTAMRPSGYIGFYGVPASPDAPAQDKPHPSGQVTKR
jgi:hypothetical protein